MDFVISILLKIALTVVKDVFCDVHCVKCKNSVWYFASFQSSDTLKSAKGIQRQK